MHEGTDNWIDLVQAEGQLWLALEIATDKVVLVNSHFQRRRAGIIDHCCTELLSQRKHTQDAAHPDLPLALMNGFAKGADVGAGVPRRESVTVR